MSFKKWLLGAAAAVALGAVGTTAHTAPLGNVLPGNAAEQNSTVQSVAWVRRCYWHRGHRHCRRIWRDYGYYGDPYYYGSPYAYGPYAYGPSFGFFFGGGRGHHHGHRHHHHGGRGHHRR